MAATQPTSFPTPPPAQTYTPPNSQGHQPYPQQFPPQLLQRNPLQYPPSREAPANTPRTLSPTSPSNIAQFPILPLLRAPKTPMYVPAALRPTERPHRPSLLTPPRSVHGSTDSLDGTENGRPPSRRSATSDSKRKADSTSLDKVYEDTPEPAIPTAGLPKVTGPPNRSHWKPDASASICDAPVCQKRFNLWERRHHCRHCGYIFCNTHSSERIPLDQNADFHPEGMNYRACGHCWAMYQRWMEERVEQARAPVEGDAVVATPAKAVGTGAATGKTGPEGQKGGVVAASLTRDWNWSTF